MTPSRFLTMAGALSLLGATGANATNLVLDPGFENPAPNPATSEATQFLGGQQMGPWSVLGVDVLLLANEHSEGSGPPLFFNAHSGDGAIDLSGDANSGPTSGISQIITTTPGQRYSVSFYVGNQSGTGTAGSDYTLPSTVDFQVDGGARASFTNENVIANGIQWTGYTTAFTATSASTTLAFLNGTPVGDNYAGLDDVSVSPAPEPAAWALMIVGLFGSGAVLRRSKRSTATA